MDLLPVDILYYIANKIDDLSIADKFRQLSSTTYLLAENIEFNELVCYLYYDIYKLVYHINTIKVIVLVNQNQIYDSNLKNVYGIKSYNIRDITLLKNYKLLQYLNIRSENIRSIEVLRHCTKLKEICLSKMRNVDFTPLSYCKELEILCLTRTRIENIAVLQYCPKLRYLSLYGTIIMSGISTLQYCAELEYLDLSFTNVTDIKPLRYCTKLKYLILRGIKKVDTKCLSHLTKLIIYR